LARPQQFSKDDIVGAAFTVVRRNGRSALSARSIARELGSSTMPIYSCMGDMDGIEEQVAIRSLELILAYQTRPVTGDAMLDFVLGQVNFAQDEPQLYRVIYLSSDASQQERKARLSTIGGTRLRAVLSRDPKYASLSPSSMKKLLERALIFAHGYASLLSLGLTTEMAPDELRHLAARVIESSRSDLR